MPASIDAKAAQSLAYYTAGGAGVLAPRGWQCFLVYGSSGSHLYVRTEPINYKNATAKFDGPAVEVAEIFGSGSGGLRVAEVIARVFPAFKDIPRQLVFADELPRFPVGPYPKDKLVYRGKATVEYTTPAQAEGLGTHFGLGKTGSPIRGVTILKPPEHNLHHLAVRLPRGIDTLAADIIRQFEIEVARTK